MSVTMVTVGVAPLCVLTSVESQPATVSLDMK